MQNIKPKIRVFKIARFCAFIFCLIAVAGNVNFASAASLSTLQQQKAAAAAAAAAAKAAAAQKAAEAASIQTQINEIQKQVNEATAALNTTNGQITETEKNIADLNTQIITQEDNLKQQQDKQNKIVAAWYMEGDNSGLFNAMVNSNSLSEMVTTEEYYDSIRQQIELAMENINKIKAELAAKKIETESKKTELTKLQQEQSAYRTVVVAQKNQQNYLLSATVAQKKDYLSQVDKLQGEVNKLSDAIYAERARLAAASNENYVDGSSGYPYGAIDVPDPWNFLTRECTSYAAWNWNVLQGKSWYNTRPGSGSAWNWPALAGDPENGYSVSSTPRVGAIVSWGQTSAMPYGHVAIVESVNGNGTVDLSEYNWRPYTYSYRANVTPGYYGSYSYIY